MLHVEKQGKKYIILDYDDNAIMESCCYYLIDGEMGFWECPEFDTREEAEHFIDTHDII